MKLTFGVAIFQGKTVRAFGADRRRNALRVDDYRSNSTADFMDEKHSARTDMTQRTITREAWKPGLGIWVLIALAFCLPFGVGMLRQSRVDDGLDRWRAAEKGSNPLKSEIAKNFPRHSQVILTWDESHIDDPRVEKLAESLNSRIDADGIRRGGLKQIDLVESPRRALKALLDAGVEQGEALRRIEGRLIGPGDLRIRLSDKGREQPELVRRQLMEGATRDLGLKLVISEPFIFAEESAQEETQTAEATQAVDSLPETIVSADYDLRVRWEGMHQNPEQVEKFINWANALSLPTVGAAEVGDAPIDECFLAAGSPVAILLHLSSAGDANPTETLRLIEEQAAAVGVSKPDLKLGGIPLLETSLQKSAREVLWNSTPGTPWYRRSSVLFSLVVLFGLTAWFTRNIAWTGLLAVVAISSVCMAVIIPTWNEPRIGIMSLLALLVVSALAMVIGQPWLHLERLYGAKGIQDPSKAARLRAWFPCLLGVLCLFAGSMTLQTYPIPPIQEFALAVAVGIFAAGVLTLYGFPLVLSAIPPDTNAESRSARRDWVHLGKLFIRRRYLITSSLILLLIGSLVGMQHVRVENLFLTNFPADSALLKESQFIDRQICGTIPVETVVVFEQSALESMDFRSRLELIRSVSTELRKLPEVTGTAALPDWTPLASQDESDAAHGAEKLSRKEKLKRNAETEALETTLRARADFGLWCRTTAANGAGQASGREFWKISAQALAEGTPERLIDRINGACQAVTRYHPGVSHLSTTEAVLSLGELESLKDAGVVSVGVIVGLSIAILLILLHNPLAAGLALIPIFLGSVLAVGCGAWLHRTIGPMQLVALPLVLGVNAFLTINLLSAFNYHLHNGRDRFAAASEAFGDFAPVLCHVNIILCAAFGVLGFAEFGMVSRFGLNVMTLLGASFVINLVGIPALSAGWIGLCFEPQKRRARRKLEVEQILDEVLPQEIVPEIARSHAGGRTASRNQGRRRIDRGPK